MEVVSIEVVEMGINILCMEVGAVSSVWRLGRCLLYGGCPFTSVPDLSFWGNVLYMELSLHSEAIN